MDTNNECKIEFFLKLMIRYNVKNFKLKNSEILVDITRFDLPTTNKIINKFDVTDNKSLEKIFSPLSGKIKFFYKLDDKVNINDNIFSLESSKNIIDVSSSVQGVICDIFVDDDAIVDKGQLILCIKKY